MLARIRREPALVLGLVQTVLGLVLAFGLDLSNEQVGAIMAVTAAVLALVTRSKVTPTPAKPKGEDGAVDPGSAALGALVAAVVVYLIMR